MVFIAFMISTVVKTENQACNVSYAIILSLLLIDGVFADAEIILKLFYNRRIRKQPIAMFVVGCLEYLPAYSYSMAFGLVASLASDKFDLNGMNWVKGRVYEDHEFYEDRVFYLSFFHTHIRAPSGSYFMNKIYTSMIFSIVMWLYLDHVVSSNRGVSYRLFFFLEKSYWMSMLPEKYRSK